MEALSVSDYRNNLAAYFDQADKGEPVLIRRRNQLYTLTSVGREELVMTPALKKRIEKVEKACREGRCITCNSKEELNSFLDSL
ncbi:MAG: type II toxin-antitoxin system Phd/YefM family antitoxin [Muribaculaceae bacterium]|nr:type II toxin-antitoxin system Phd/YefM family antitoxin [Muribaculaceae bacterium]